MQPREWIKTGLGWRLSLPTAHLSLLALTSKQMAYLPAHDRTRRRIWVARDNAFSLLRRPLYQVPLKLLIDAAGDSVGALLPVSTAHSSRFSCPGVPGSTFRHLRGAGRGERCKRPTMRRWLLGFTTTELPGFQA